MTDYRHGDHNGICQVCGFKYKFSALKLRWDRLWVCSKDWEVRPPQDFVRGRADKQSVPVSRPGGTNRFVGTNEVTADDL